MYLVRSTGRTAIGGRASAGSGGSDQSASMIIELNKQISELKMTVDGLEKERDFYFGKLRDIEILVQEELDAAEQQEPGHVELPIMKEIQAILYSTEVNSFNDKSVLFGVNIYIYIDNFYLYIIIMVIYRRVLKYLRKMRYLENMMIMMMKLFNSLF